MAFLTRTHLSRRTFLRGMGVTLALPLLDSMVPAATALGADGGQRPRTRFGAIYFPHGAIMNKWTPATAGAGFELTRDPAAAQAVLRPGQRRQRPRHALAYGSGATANHNRSAAAFLSGAFAKTGAKAQLGITVDQVAARAKVAGHAAAVARADDRGAEPQLRRRPELLLSRHDLVAGPLVAAADAEQPAGGVRAAVRRRQHRRGAQGAARAVDQPARLGAGRSRRRCSRSCRPPTARGSTST